MPRRIQKCVYCSSLIKNEAVTLEYRWTKKAHIELHKRVYCSADCMVEALYDEQIKDEINRKVRKEVNWLHKQICPACRRRIT